MYLLVIGIGGSYLGARAAIEAYNTAFIMHYQKKSARHHKLFLLEIILVPLI